MKVKVCPLHIRWMIRRDYQEVLAIEEASFSYPWGKEKLVYCLRPRNHNGMVAEYNERIIGFMIYGLHKSHIRLLNFAVHPDWQRRGVGAQMTDKLIGKLSSRRNEITLTVRETNLPAQLFFKEQGFKAAEVLHGFYEDSGEDAYFMEYHLSDKVDTEGLGVNRIARYDQGEW